MITRPLLIVTTRLFDRLLEEAATHYQANASPDISENFISAVERAIKKIAEAPEASARYLPPSGFKPLKELHYRQINLANSSPFPYTIYYEIELRRIVVHVIYHHSRNRDALLYS